ncbi:MAG: ecdysteroid 22-kinase family protein [Gammaproteobacteria bacterium]|nr:ecdysteroid 22-kinase family protein [Gammaproteobacteria bacterium]
MKSPTQLPRTPADLTSALLSELMGVAVDSVQVLDAQMFGADMVSTSGRATIAVKYAAAARGLPTRLVVKMARVLDRICEPFYSNEVAFYGRLRAECDIQAPRHLGSSFDPESGLFALVLEDLMPSGARFPKVTDAIGVEQVRSLLETLAHLHAKFWCSPRFTGDLAWVETHLIGGVAGHMHEFVPPHIRREVETDQIKREIVQSLGWSADQLCEGVNALQVFQQTLPQTIIHGDTHIGNTYLLPSGEGGLLDWQLMMRGPAVHDVAYLIATALPIADRREHERELLTGYLQTLTSLGVHAPGFEETWTEYRRAMIWGLYIGWLTTPASHYGPTVTTVSLLRMAAAFEDLDTGRLVRQLG